MHGRYCSIPGVEKVREATEQPRRTLVLLAGTYVEETEKRTEAGKEKIK